MKSIEELVALFASVPVAERDRWTVTPIVSGRLYLSRGTHGEFAIFIEGGVDTFGPLPPWTSVAHSTAVIALPDRRHIAALRITSEDQINGNRVVAHIAYELGRRLAFDGSIKNDELLGSVLWILPLLGDPDAILGVERQYGLVGECILLVRLLTTAAKLNIARRAALERWKGAGGSKRDFAAGGIAIEVKTTSHATRLHHFGSIEQLDPQSPGEEVFLFSLGIRLDPSAPKKLPDYFTDVESGMVHASGERDEEAIQRFRGELLQYGYNPLHEALYRVQSGFAPPHLLPALFREQDLDRVRHTSFKGDKLPSMVVNVGYDLEVHGPGLNGETTDAVLTRLLISPALGPT